MSDLQGLATRRSGRQHRIPTHLRDYYLGEAPQVQGNKPLTLCDRLVRERDLILGDIHRNCDKADQIINVGGSNTTLQRLDTRLEKSLTELHKVTNKLASLVIETENSDDEMYHVSQFFTITRAQVEDCQDRITEELGTREGDYYSSTRSSHNGSVKSSSLMHKFLTKSDHTPMSLTVAGKPTLPLNKEIDVGKEQKEDENSEHNTDISHASWNSTQARVNMETAVNQAIDMYEDEQCQNEQRIQEAERQLRQQLKQSKTTFASPEVQMHDIIDRQRNSTPQVKQELPRAVQRSMYTGMQPVYHSTPFTPSPQAPVERHLESLFPKPSRNSDSPHNTKQDNNSSVDVNKFFQGIAKPSLPKFSGDKDQFQDWREQFDIFVNQVDVPVRFKMVMLKSSLTGRPLQLVSRLGYTEHQYQMALTKLEQRYGGERRQLQRHLDALIALPAVKEDNLRGLEDLANRLCDTVAKLADSGHEAELIGVSTLYTLVLQKVPDSLVLQYYDTRPKMREDGLSTFTDWLNQQICVRLELAEIKEKPKKLQTDSSRSLTNSKKPQYSNVNASRATSASSKKSKASKSTPPDNTTSNPSDSNNSCPMCKENHHVTECEQWNSTSVDDRWTLAKSRGLCFRCLHAYHLGKNCPNTSKCNINGCTKTHHKHLHRSESTNPDVAQNAFGVAEDGKVIPTKVALRLLPVFVHGKNGQKQKVNAFLDDGSDSTYIRSDIAVAMGLDIQDNELTVSTLLGQGNKVNSGLVAITIESLDGHTQRTIGARTLDSMCDKLEIPNWHKHSKEWRHLEGIEFPTLPGRRTVDILIGADHPELSLSLEERIGQPGEPVARKTPLGWTCVGTYSNSNDIEHSKHSAYARTFHVQSGQVVSLDDALRNMWNMDAWEANREDLLTAEEQRAATKAAKSIKSIGDRYEIAIPWKDERPNLPDNRTAAERRLYSLEKSLARRPALADRYKEVMEANIQKGYFERVNTDIENPQPSWYLPHFPVVREDKATTKVRIVYDSAAKYDGVSLNDVMLPGPKLQLDVIDILLRFRRKRVAIVGDIKEMFSQVVMAKEDRPFHRILWRDLDTSKPVAVYEATRLTFGDCASPYLAQYVVRTHAENNSLEFPQAATVCSESMYMDDVMDSEDSEKEAVLVREQLTSLLSTAGFQIRRWCSNSPLVLEGIPEEDRATGVKVDESSIPSIKTLGLRWDAATDNFRFDFTEQPTAIHTKRSILSRVATLFDPLQFLAPFIIRAKMLLQESWILGLGWDDEFPPDLSRQTSEWYSELPQVAEIKIPRCFQSYPTENTSLHTFTDASSQAYGAVTYLRSVHEDKSVSVRFVIAKAKVAPLKAVSIPRLELMAALLGLRLAVRVSTILQMPLSQHTFWSDSMDVIHWVRGQSRRYKPFVAHRVAEMQSKTNPSQWNHVPGKANPADLASRGVKLRELIEVNVWINGPEFLYGEETTWPQTPMTDYSHTGDALKDMSRTCTQLVETSTDTVPESSFPIQYDRFSIWNRLLRATAWALRFTKLLKDKNHVLRPSSSLQQPEILDAEKLLIRNLQREKFADTINKLEKGQQTNTGPLKSLSPFLDGDGILRVGGRLQNADIPYDAKHPILIPHRHHVTTLIVRHYHIEIGKHAKGVNAILAETRQRFWIVHGREEVKRVQRACRPCQRRRKRVAKQIMAPLPVHRITVPVRAFAISGLDYAGPFFTKLTRRVVAKRYLCLFTCTTSRAVHLELAYSLDTDSFLNAFSRMVARRGKPEEVVSDNGTNFVGANKELGQLVQAMDKNKITDKAANQGIKWRFNPPLGSHHGGLFEALIKSAKTALKAILGNARVTDEELHTAIVEVEGLMNSRPLTYCGNDPKDEPVLTPNHFLYGQAGGQLAPRIVDEVACSPRHRWRFVQGLVKQVWQRWNREYLSLLQNRGKWWTEHCDLKINDIVTLVHPSNPRGHWPLGRVLETFPGEDGHIRTVKVLSGGKTFIRPITKLCPLEAEVTNKEVTKPVGHGEENGATIDSELC